ncbi:phenylacetate--CoA ligase family protein [Clostridium sp. PL3]|uniref:Phenylacetate--CoA ligase family protein n=1 Tax=Clostridium thailandense TaxID=2794346 RepID=A0A949U066_9CLOT|nr:AMP-binding protein [Clostridium thailandense]MBV7274048.1 phenylacetate--CoA ligase family protein [Clostridium thailandense]
MKLTPIEKYIKDKVNIHKNGREELERYQLDKIKESITYVKQHSKFYREHLKDINEDSIKSLKDFENIPFTLPSHVKENPFGFLCVPQKDIVRIVTLRSSGTSGDEKRVYFTEKDLQLTIDFFKHGMQCLANKDDRVLVLLPGEAYGSIGDLLKKALKETEIECFVQGVMVDPKVTAKLIQAENINCIVGIPIQLLHLSRVENEIFKNKIQKVLLSTDYVPETIIKEFTNKSECKVFTHYGMTEMGYGGGVECEALYGYHMREDDLYFEIIDPVTGKTVEDGQYGEVVFTTLTREGMPFIRYRTSDIASFKTKKCPCGTFLKTMDRIKGRMENRIKIDEDEFIYMRELDEIILSFEEVVNYKVYIEEGNVIFLDLITLNEADFYKSSEKILSLIKAIPSIKKSLSKNIIEIVIIYSLDDIVINNTMVKRKIHDYRKRV